MKIGIITFHRAHNYGAQLQAYALSRTIEELGHTVEFIDYRQPSVEKYYQIFNLDLYTNSSLSSKIKILISRLFTLKKRIQRHWNFKAFSSRWIKTSLKVRTLKSDNLYYDILVFGSDQIWTTRFLHTFDCFLWGDVHIKSKKKIAYAPSMEMLSLDGDQEKFCKAHLKNFDVLSARENTMKNMLSPLTDKEIKIVLDPVFLRSKREYKNLSKISSIKLPNKYLLIYSIGKPSAEIVNIAKRIAKLKNLSIKRLAGDVFLHSERGELPTAGPYDFLKVFNNADFIITTTFHGTAFSILFQKQFFAIKNNSGSARIEDILEKIGLSNRLLSSDLNPDFVCDMDFDIDYTKPNLKLNQLKKESLDFLNSHLS